VMNADVFPTDSNDRSRSDNTGRKDIPDKNMAAN
jgi:hypothetical protein